MLKPSIILMFYVLASLSYSQEYLCRIGGLKNGCGYCSGSGVIVARNDLWDFILTAQHVVEDTEYIYYRYQEGIIPHIDTIQVISKHRDIDMALCRSTKTNYPICPIDWTGLKIGDAVQIAGYGSPEEKVRVFNSFVIFGGTEFDDIFLEGTARHGDSGGPIVRDGKLVGVLWGITKTSTFASAVGKQSWLKQYLEKEKAK